MSEVRFIRKRGRVIPIKTKRQKVGSAIKTAGVLTAVGSPFIAEMSGKFAEKLNKEGQLLDSARSVFTKKAYGGTNVISFSDVRKASKMKKRANMLKGFKRLKISSLILGGLSLAYLGSKIEGEKK